MNTTLLTAFGLMLVLEGILPLIAPKAWRQTFQRMIALNDGQLRFIGVISMLAGLLLILIIH
ncbi:MAG TPA: DUF2065 domain-containing protein [Methylophilaceae bacterium]|nr:DUF2065 domain-containing protein [Methylophilaceae bacterium]